MGQAQPIAYRVTRVLRAGLIVLGLALLDLPGLPGQAAEDSEPVAAVAVRISAETERTRFIVDFTRAVGFKVYVLPDPYRVIVDLPDVEFRLPAASGATASGLVAGYRFGSLELGRSRIVMDADQPVLIERSFILHPQDGEPARLVVDLVATDAATFTRMQRAELVPLEGSAAAEDDVPTELAPISIGPPPSLAEAADSGENLASADDPAREPAASQESTEALGTVPLPRPKPGSNQVAALGTLTDQAEEETDSRPVVVIDPGHGGIDPGTVSRTGTAEKDVVQAFSLVLKQALEAAGRYDVHLTRSKDVFLSLNERVKFARERGADLFIAIHADSLRRGTARGATVYTLADKASDAEAEALAHKENRSDIIAGVDLVAESEQITGILIDLAQRETKNHATTFAKQLVGKLKPV